MSWWMSWRGWTRRELIYKLIRERVKMETSISARYLFSNSLLEAVQTPDSGHTSELSERQWPATGPISPPRSSTAELRCCLPRYRTIFEVYYLSGNLAPC